MPSSSITYSSGHRLLNYGIAALITAACLLVFAYRLTLAFYPTPNTGGAENNIIYFVQRLLDEQTLYSDPEQPPFAITQYAPLYYYLVTAVCQLFAVSSNEVTEIFTINRLLSLLLHLVVSLSVTLMLRRLATTGKWTAVAGGMIVFIFLLPTSRPDNLSLLFWMLGFWFFGKTLNEDRQSHYLKNYLLSATAGVLAAWTKQNAVTILLLIVVWLVLTTQWKKSFLYITCCMLLSAISFIPAITIFGFDPLYKNMITGLNNGINLQAFTSIFLSYYLKNFYLILVMTGCCICLWRHRGRVGAFLVFCMTGQFLFANLFAVKTGSGLNYLMEWMVLLVMAAIFCWPFFRQWTERRAKGWNYLLLSVLLVWHTLPFLKSLYWHTRTQHFEASKAYYNQEKSVAGHIMVNLSKGNYIISTIPTSNSFLSNLCSDQLLMPQSDIIQTVYERKIFNYKKWEEAVAQNRVAYFITTRPVNTFIFLDKNLGIYQLDTVIGAYRIYKKF